MPKRLADIRREAGLALWRAGTIARVGMRTRIAHGPHLARRSGPAPRASQGEAEPTLIFRFLAENSPHRPGLICPEQVGPHAAGDPPRETGLLVLRAERADGSGRVRPGAARARARLAGPPDAEEPAGVRARAIRARPLGGAAVSISWRSTAPEIEYVAKHSGARAIFFDATSPTSSRAAIAELPGIRRENMSRSAARWKASRRSSRSSKRRPASRRTGAKTRPS